MDVTRVRPIGVNEGSRVRPGELCLSLLRLRVRFLSAKGHVRRGVHLHDRSVFVRVLPSATANVSTRLNLEAIHIGGARTRVDLIQVTGRRRSIATCPHVEAAPNCKLFFRVDRQMFRHVRVSMVVARAVRFYGFCFRV